MADRFLAGTDCEMDADPAVCAVEISDPDDPWNMKSDTFDLDDCAGKQSVGRGRSGQELRPGSAYWHKCAAARVAARQRAVDRANVVDGYHGHVDRRWRVGSNRLNDDRRVPILWITTGTGLRYDCYSALLIDYGDYHPVHEVDYGYMRDAASFRPGLSRQDPDYEHHWLCPELMTEESTAPTAPAVESGSLVSPSVARLDMAKHVCVAYDRCAHEDSDPNATRCPGNGVWAGMDT